MNSKRLLDVATIILCACALMSTGILVRRDIAAPRVIVADAAPEEVHNWRDYSNVGLRIGPANAPITITEFSDFQCPFCRELNGALLELRKQYPTQVAVVYRHYPLERIHPYAHTAALAAECAATQGRFEAFNDSVFARQDSLGRWSWARFGAVAGVADTAAFSRCVTDSAFVGHLQRDVAAAKALQVLGTPTVLVNRWRVRGPNTRETLDTLIRKELKALRIVVTADARSR